ncbi:UDP-N-acetylmuramyl-tripeptide synthetase [Candidatus Falkowbacteria bacterium]|nr:UDP-N-acetylmuramyl-tripeptide synthetase [Candidatus Falkowbacteria bacterium]
MEGFLNLVKRIIPTKIFKALQPIYHYILSWLSAFVYAWPSEKIIVIGITGTTGKTSSVYIMAKMLRALGYRVGYTSTAMFSDGDRDWLNDKKMTMVGRLFTQKMLARMVRNKCQFAIIETSSEGIRQFRHRFINYDWVIFTGLYPEHIESHGSFENYKEAKGKLFKHLKKCSTKYANEELHIFKTSAGFKKLELNRIKKTIIANLDDEYASYFLDFWSEEKIGYSQKKEAVSDLPENLKAINYGSIKTNKQGISFEVMGERIYLGLFGKFNATNTMSAVSVAALLEKEPNEVKEALSQVDSVPGRIEKIDEGQDFTVIVDYAFEPKAMNSLYEVVDDIPHEKVIHVLGGTGGGRDKDRRPKIGRIAGKKADIVIVTNEDPYDEDPEQIMAQVAEGARKSGKKDDKDLFIMIDRGKAIEKAAGLADEDDVVLITGKGCEQAICVACGRKMKWDDREVARQAIKSKNKSEG